MKLRLSLRVERGYNIYIYIYSMERGCRHPFLEQSFDNEIRAIGLRKIN